jgi:hypothetical protein
MSLFFPRELTIERKASGSYDASGIWVDGAPSTFTIRGSFQPDRRTVETTEVGRTDIGQASLYTEIDTVLEVSQEGEDVRGDVLIVDGQRWELIEERPWNNGILAHHEYRLRYEGAA